MSSARRPLYPTFGLLILLLKGKSSLFYSLLARSRNRLLCCLKCLQGEYILLLFGQHACQRGVGGASMNVHIPLPRESSQPRAPRAPEDEGGSDCLSLRVSLTIERLQTFSGLSWQHPKLFLSTTVKVLSSLQGSNGFGAHRPTPAPAKKTVWMTPGQPVGSANPMGIRSEDC